MRYRRGTIRSSLAQFLVAYWPLLLFCVCAAGISAIHNLYFPNLYDELGVSHDASSAELRKAYRKCVPNKLLMIENSSVICRWALKHHPDKHLDGDPESQSKYYTTMTVGTYYNRFPLTCPTTLLPYSPLVFVCLVSAFEQIMNDESRRRYDTLLLGPLLMIVDIWNLRGDAKWHQHLVMLFVAILVGLLVQFSVVCLFYLFRFLYYLGRRRAAGGLVWILVAVVVFCWWRDLTAYAVTLLFAVFILDALLLRNANSNPVHADTTSTPLDDDKPKQL